MMLLSKKAFKVIEFKVDFFRVFISFLTRNTAIFFSVFSTSIMRETRLKKGWVREFKMYTKFKNYALEG